jgi:hypothetical protein
MNDFLKKIFLRNRVSVWLKKGTANNSLKKPTVKAVVLKNQASGRLKTKPFQKTCLKTNPFEKTCLKTKPLKQALKENRLKTSLKRNSLKPGLKIKITERLF